MRWPWRRTTARDPDGDPDIISRSRETRALVEALADRLEATTRELERRIEARSAQQRRGGGSGSARAGT